MRIVNGKKIETAMRRPPENAMRPPAEPKEEIPKPKHVGGGWYLVGEEKIQGKDAAYEAWHGLFANSAESR